MRGTTTAPVPAAMSRSDTLPRSDTLRIRGSRRADTITQRLVRTMPERGPTGSTTRAWLAQNLRVAVMAAAAIAAVALSLGTSTKLGPRTTTLSRSVGHQSLYASSYNSGGISISHRLSRRRTRSTPGRVLEEEGEAEDVVSKPLVAYETQLELYLCNPSLVVDGNDAYTVDESRLAAALGRIAGLGEATTTDGIAVSIKTGPADADDSSYMCDSEGMLQWHLQVKYSAEAAAAANTTPAVMAAQANDYVAYSGDDFKSLLAAYVNDEYATSPDSVDLSADDIVVATIGWIVTFPSEVSTTQDTQPSDSGGLAVDLAEESDLWAWWVWLIYGLLVACCLMPLCCFLCRRRKEDKNTVNEPLATTRRGRDGDALDKIRGPEWGITELDFEGDHRTYGNQEMKREYDAAGKVTQPVAYKSSQRPGHQSVSGQAWMQEGGGKSAWARTSSNSPSTQQNNTSGGQYPPHNSKNSVARRFDIDDKDEEGADGQEAARMRGGRHSHYSFDARASGERTGARAVGERTGGGGGGGGATRQGSSSRGGGGGEAKS